MRSFVIRTLYIITIVIPSYALALGPWFGGGTPGVPAATPPPPSGGPRNLKELIDVFTGLINPLIGLLTGIAVLIFCWGIVQYILYAGDEKKKKSAKDTLLYGIIALFVLFSFWSIVQLLKKSIFG